MADPVIRRLMTLRGVDMTVATAVAAAIDGVRFFPDPRKLVGYLGLNASIRESGEGPYIMPRDMILLNHHPAEHMVALGPIPLEVRSGPDGDALFQRRRARRVSA